MRIVTWNLNNRKSNQQAWDALFELSPDIALLSEVNFVPEDLSGYNSVFEYSMGDNGSPRNFKTGILCKGTIGPEIPLIAEEPWISNCLNKDTGNLVARKVEVADGRVFNVISAYLAHTPYPHQEHVEDISCVVLPDYTEIFMGDLLWASMKHILPNFAEPWIVGGDFNVSEFLGSKRNQKANVEAIKRLERLGLKEIVRHYHGGPVPSWKPNQRNAPLKHQLDHLYVSETLLENMHQAVIGDFDTYVGSGFTDHMPVIADFQ